MLHNAIAGLVVGFLVGLTGMGGGSLMAPLLIYVFHYKAKIAVGSDLAYGAIARIFGSWQHYRNGSVDIALALKMSLGSVPGSLLGVWALHAVDVRNSHSAERLITHVLGVVLLLTAGALIAQSVPAVKLRVVRRQRLQGKPGFGAALAIGVILGFLVGMTSVGAGTLFAVALLFVFGLGAKETVGTDMFHAVILSSAAALGHLAVGDVSYPLVASLLAGAVPGIVVGSKVSLRTPEFVLRPTIAVVLIASGLRTLLA